MKQEELLFIETTKYFLKIIKDSDYPTNHPFLEDTFENDYLMKILVLLKLFFNPGDVIEGYLKGKLKSHNDGIFALDKFHQNVSELTFLWYLVSSLQTNGNYEYIQSFTYEPNGNKEKKLEYSFIDPISKKNINFEVKNVTCDPFLKDTDKDFKIGNKYIKTYFGEEIVKLEEDTKDYIVLKHSSQYKQIRSALKKIAEKFEVKDSNINIGVVVCQFATSYEEFLSYFMHPKKGYVFKNKSIFKNFDAVVFYSLSATPDIIMDDIYRDCNTFTIVTSNNIQSETLETFRLDNIACYNGRVIDEVIPFAKEEYGKFVFENRHRVLSFFREDISEQQKDEYCEEIAKTLYASMNPKVHQC